MKKRRTRRSRNRRHRNPRLVSRRGLGDAFANLVTLAAFGVGGYVIYLSYNNLKGSSNGLSVGPWSPGPARLGNWR